MCRVPDNSADRHPYNLPDTLPGLALKKTLGNLGMDLGFYLQLLQQYSREKSEFCTLLRQALEEGQVKKATVLVHGFKGVTSNLGLENLAKISYCLEKALLKEAQASINNLLDRLETEQEVALESMKILFKTTEGGFPQG